MFFEDRDGDTKIKTEPMTSDPDSLEVLQRNYYYPFGMEMEGPWNSQTGPGMRYLYNGKEFNEDLGLRWYDYGARYYDPSIGRWTQVDPLADEAPEWTPYRYAFNNPIFFIDPDGLFEDEAAAKKYAKEHGIKIRPKSFIGKLFTSGSRSNIVQGRDGLFSIEQGGKAITDLGGDFGVVEGIQIKPTDVMSLEIEGNIVFGETWTATLRDGSELNLTPITGDAPNPGKPGRSAWQKKKYLKSLFDTGKWPKWMKPWLKKGKVPPGYEVEHVNPLSVGGADKPHYMKLNLKKNHTLWHKFYRPWKKKKP